MRQLANNKTGLYLLLILLLVMIIFFVLTKHKQQNSFAQTNINNDATGSQLTVQPAIQESSTGAISSSSISPATAHSETMPTTIKKAQDIAIYSDWLKKQGYLRSNVDDYDSYGRDTLKKLALNNGDENAVRKAGQRYWREEGIEIAIDFYRDAAVRGSTAALRGLSGIVLAHDYENTTDIVEKKAATIEILALNEVAKMRGNQIYNSISNIGNYHIFERDNITITDADQALIQARAQNIYDDLQKNRNDLGLGLFDNSEPEAVKEQFESLNKSLKENK